jgi:hypothetical protein
MTWMFFLSLSKMGPFLPKFLVKKLKNFNSDFCYPTTSLSVSIGSIHNWGTKEGKKLKDFLKLFFTHNVYMK